MAGGSEHGFTWMQIFPGVNHLPDHVATAGLVTAVLVGTAVVARRQIARTSDPALPDGTLTARNAMEVYVEWFTNFAAGILGPHSKHLVPFYGALFLFILANNMIGLIPGFSPPTGNVNTTLGLGILSFLMYNYVAFRAHGIAYLKHFIGPIWWLFPLMLPLEIIDNVLRPLTLNLRLLMNMFADHLVLDIFTDLTRLIIPIAFYLLGIIVVLIQAFVFTVLSMVYVALALGGHDHAEEHAHAQH
jgi:F-type H+-transporting ATPase subunit a